MERHIAKRMGIACAVISAPVHVQDFPARYAPHMGYEGANQLFDAWVAPLMMGLEEHLLKMFKEDFEFHPQAVASHLGVQPMAPEVDKPSEELRETPLAWSDEAQRELGRIPFFVRSKAKRNTERYAQAHGVSMIQRDTLYEAKAFYARPR